MKGIRELNEAEMRAVEGGMDPVSVALLIRGGCLLVGAAVTAGVMAIAGPGSSSSSPDGGTN